MIINSWQTKQESRAGTEQRDLRSQAPSLNLAHPPLVSKAVSSYYITPEKEKACLPSPTGSAQVWGAALTSSHHAACPVIKCHYMSLYVMSPFHPSQPNSTCTTGDRT